MGIYIQALINIYTGHREQILAFVVGTTDCAEREQHTARQISIIHRRTNTETYLYTFRIK